MKEAKTGVLFNCVFFIYNKIIYHANRPNNTEEKNSNIVAELVRKEADQRRGDEDTEGKDCVPVVGAMSKICIANNYLTRKKCK